MPAGKGEETGCCPLERGPKDKQPCVAWLFEKGGIVNGGLDLWAAIAS